MFVFFSLYYVCLFFSSRPLNETVIPLSAVFKAFYFFAAKSLQCVRIVYGLEPESVQVSGGSWVSYFSSPSTAIGFGLSPFGVLDKFTVKVYDNSARYREYENAWELLEK